MVGKTTVSSNGTSRRDGMACGFTFCSNLPLVGAIRVPPPLLARNRSMRRRLRFRATVTVPQAGRASRNQPPATSARRYLSGRHAQRAVQPDDLAVEHRVLD